MRYLHSMVRVKNLDDSIRFYKEALGLVETRRTENERGRFTLVFLAAPGDVDGNKPINSPLIELTYNWPNENGQVEDYGNSRNFGHLAFAVDDIYKKCAELMDMGITLNRPPRDGYMAFIKSPDNISIELLQKGKPLEPVEPWASMENSGSW